MFGFKKLARKFFIFFIVLVLLWQYLPTLTLTGGFEMLLLAAVVLTALDTFLKPLLKAIMVPVNFFTFGLLGWVSAFVVFFLTTKFVKGIEVVDWTFPEIKTDYFIIPQTPITGIWAIVVTSIFVVILAKFINWVFKKKSV